MDADGKRRDPAEGGWVNVAAGNVSRIDAAVIETLRTFRALERCNATLASPDDFQVTFAGYQHQGAITLIERTYQHRLALHSRKVVP